MSTSDTKTDDSHLVTTDTVYVSPDGGTTDEAFPKPNVEYDFCVDVASAGKLPSGSFFVRFNLSGDQDPPLDLDFTQDAGLDAQQVRHVSSRSLYLLQFSAGEADQLCRLIQVHYQQRIDERLWFWW
jgi:hypothetical protein